MGISIIQNLRRGERLARLRAPLSSGPTRGGLARHSDLDFAQGCLWHQDFFLRRRRHLLLRLPRSQIEVEYSPLPALGGAFMAWVMTTICFELDYNLRPGLLPTRDSAWYLRPHIHRKPAVGCASLRRPRIRGAWAALRAPWPTQLSPPHSMSLRFESSLAQTPRCARTRAHVSVSRGAQWTAFVSAGVRAHARVVAVGPG